MTSRFVSDVAIVQLAEVTALYCTLKLALPFALPVYGSIAFINIACT